MQLILSKGSESRVKNNQTRLVLFFRDACNVLLCRTIARIGEMPQAEGFYGCIPFLLAKLP